VLGQERASRRAEDLAGDRRDDVDVVLFHQLLDDRLIRRRTSSVVLDAQELDLVPLHAASLVELGYPGVEPIRDARIVGQLRDTTDHDRRLGAATGPGCGCRTHRQADDECA
jgi:hypothetical protein